MIRRLARSFVAYHSTWDTVLHLWLSALCLFGVLVLVPAIEPVKHWVDVLN